MPFGSIFDFGFAFSLGVGTFFAPCAYPLLPSYIAYYLGGDDETEKSVLDSVARGALVGVVVSLGFLVVYLVLGLIVAGLGSQYLSGISVLELVVGVILIFLGIVTFAGFEIPLSSLHIQLPERERTMKGFFAFGVIYAAAAAGCTGPLFLAVVGRAVTSGPVGGVATIGAYAAGMSILMVSVTVATALGKGSLLKRINTPYLKKSMGLLMIGAGIFQIYFYLTWTGVIQPLF